MTNRDDIYSSPSPTERIQRELREALYLFSDDLSEIEDSNARYLLNSVVLRRCIPETQHLINVVERAKALAKKEGH